MSFNINLSGFQYVVSFYKQTKVLSYQAAIIVTYLKTNNILENDIKLNLRFIFDRLI